MQRILGLLPGTGGLCRPAQAPRCLAGRLESIGDLGRSCQSARAQSTATERHFEFLDAFGLALEPSQSSI